MTYSQKVWKDLPDESTPLNAAGLNDLESRIASILGSIGSFGVNVKDFGAKGDGVTDDTAAFQAAIAANKGSIMVPPSASFYKLTDTLTLNSNDQGIWGVDYASCKLKWTTDLGAGRYGIIAPTGLLGSYIQGLTLTGPGAAVVYGTHPCNMSGVFINAGGRVERCYVQNFNYGIFLKANHEEVANCRFGGNYYGIYWGPGSITQADQHVERCGFDNNAMAGIGVAGDNQIGGVSMIDLHFANMPYGIYGEPSTGGAGFIVGLELLDVAFEGYHNGAIFAEAGGVGPAARGCTGLWMRGVGEGSGFTSPVGGLTLAKAQIDVPGAIYIDTDFWPFSIVENAAFSAGQGITAKYMYMQNLIDSAVSTAKPMGLGGTITGIKGDGIFNSQVLGLKNGGLGSWSANNVVAGYDVDKCRSLVIGASLPRGVALQPSTITGVIPVVVGGVCDISTDDVTLTGADFYLKLSVDGGGAWNGKVEKASGPTDGTVVGLTLKAYNAGLVRARLRGFL